LVDDFTGSGTSLLRKPDPSKGWKGKIAKFIKDIGGRLNDPDDSITIREGCLAEGVVIVAHHYLATDKARAGNEESVRNFAKT